MIDSPAEPVPAVRPDAAAEPPQSQLPMLAPVAGAFHVRETVDQVITPNDYPRLISLVRALAPDTGTARELGDGLQWEQDSGFSSLSLTINPEPTGLVIRADLRTDGERVAYALGVGGTTFLGALGGLSSGLGGPAVMGVTVATLLGGSWVARQLLRYSDRRRAADLKALVAQIAAGLRGDVT